MTGWTVLGTPAVSWEANESEIRPDGFVGTRDAENFLSWPGALRVLPGGGGAARFSASPFLGRDTDRFSGVTVSWGVWVAGWQAGHHTRLHRVAAADDNTQLEGGRGVNGEGARAVPHTAEGQAKESTQVTFECTQTPQI